MEDWIKQCLFRLILLLLDFLVIKKGVIEFVRVEINMYV